jgi:hypothetical protein
LAGMIRVPAAAQKNSKDAAVKSIIDKVKDS